MATAGFQELAEDLECPICLGELDIPKVLPCKHVFCAGCLQKWLHGNKLVCPVCRYEHIFSKNTAIKDLPEPLIITRLQEKITQFLSASQETGPVSRECGFCKGAAIHFCSTCNENLCNACTKKHSISKRTNGHMTTQVSKWTVCSLHQSKLTVGYCKQCKVGLCGLCMNMEHADHDVVDVNDKTLIHDKTSVLKSYQKHHAKHMDYNAYKDELNLFMKKLQKQCNETEIRLEKLRTELNAAIDELKTGLRQHLAAEEKKMVIHKAEIDDIRATRDSLFTFIDDVLQRNSAPDIVMAADELPDISDNTAPVPPICKQPEIAEYDIIIQSIKDLVQYKRQLCNIIPPSGHRANVTGTESTVVNPRVKIVHALISDPEPVLGPFVALSPSTPSLAPDILESTASPSNVFTFDDSSLSPTLSAGPVGVGARSKKGGGGKIAWDDTVPSPQPPVSREYTQVWEVNPGGNTHDVIWDEKESLWWMRTNNGGLYKYNMEGSLVDRVGGRALQGLGRICIDTKRGLLVTPDNNKTVVCIRKSGEWVKDIIIPGCGCLRGIIYCPHRDVYVVSDTDKHCLWFLDSQNGRVIKQLGSKASGDGRFNWPGFLCHKSIDDNSCHIVVSVGKSKCIKVFSNTGEFLSKSKGSGEGQLIYPCGVCVDCKGRVVVCDKGNNKVLRYWWDEGEKWEVILNAQQLQGSVPWCVSMTPDGRHLVVGMFGSPVSRCYSCGP